jgi:lycopene beta-cyclase
LPYASVITVKTDVDYVIVGAGCAGLSLGVHLAEAGLSRHRRVLLVDPRTQFERDRTWCFFDVEPHPFRRCISRRWRRWTVNDGGVVIDRGSATHPYAHIPSDAFYREALARLDAHGGFEVRTGVRAHEIEDLGDHVRVITDLGPVTAKAAFDGRPSSARSRHAHAHGGREVRLLQHFRGFFVRSSAPAFDPSRASLMDFDVPQDDGTHFAYVLPFSAHEALVEDTYFSTHVPSLDVYEANVRAYLARRGIEDYVVTHEERGAIPMTTESLEQRPSPRVYHIGLAGGLARPATGYAFLAIQRFSRAFARALVEAGPHALPEPPGPRSARTMLLDRTFLTYLHERPESGPWVFARLFERVAPDVLARFLSEKSSFADDLQIMTALPTLPFAGSMIKAIDGLVRRSERTARYARVLTP